MERVDLACIERKSKIDQLKLVYFLLLAFRAHLSRQDECEQMGRVRKLRPLLTHEDRSHRGKNILVGCWDLYLTFSELCRFVFVVVINIFHRCEISHGVDGNREGGYVLFSNFDFLAEVSE